MIRKAIHNDYLSNKDFITSKEYKTHFQRLYDKNKLMIIMICNDIVVRINHIELLCASYSSFKNCYQSLSNDEKSYYSAKLKDFIIVEDIIYHARKTVDQMIYGLWINKVGVNNINDKTKEIDSIGKYLKRQTKYKVIDELDSFYNFIDNLNEISNSYKHSVSDFSHIETDLNNNQTNPVFYSYTFKENDKDIKIGQYELIEQIKKMFDHFLSCI